MKAGSAIVKLFEALKLGVHVEEIRKWDAAGAPPMAEKLLLLWDKKRVGIEGWECFMFSRGVLRKGRRRWTPKMIEELFRPGKRNFEA